MTRPPRPVAGYSRVSTQRQSDEGMSLEMQRRAIAQYCAAMGLPEPISYEDAGISAFKERIEHRPAFARLLADAEAGAIGTIVVASLDRWSRKLRVIDDTLRRLGAAGVGLISLREHLDYSTAVGKLTINMLGAIAQHTSDDRSETARRVHAELRSQGRWDGGSPPYGALVGEDGKLALDPDKLDTLARVLALVAEVSFHQAADVLNAEGIPPPGAVRRYVAGPPRGWWPTALRNTVKGGTWLLAQPDPWPSRYLAAATRIGHPPVARTRTTRLLTGLSRCHACGHAVVYSPSGPQGQHLRLRCETPGCKLSYGRADRHERAVLDAVRGLRPRPQPPAHAGIDLRALQAIAEAQRRWRLMFGRLEIDEATYEEEMAQLKEREATLLARAAPGRDVGQLADVLPHLDTMAPERANLYLRRLLTRVVLVGKDERRLVWQPETTEAFAGCV